MTRLTPLRAIRAKCLDCCAGQVAEVRRCELENCPLFPYRFGKRPKEGIDTPDSSFSEKAHENRGFFTGEKVCSE